MKKQTRKMDLRGLAAHEKRVGEIVQFADGSYRVKSIEGGSATLEKIATPPDGEKHASAD